MWNDARIKFIKENFIAVAVPIEMCYAKNPEGEFLRGAGIDKSWVTSSGYMNCVSASGRNLGDMASEQVLEAFRKLPAAERTPGGITVPDMKPSEHLIPAPPPGGLVLKVHGRFLARDARGELRHIKGDDFPQLRGKDDAIRELRFLLEPNTEYMWLTADEWKALVPASPSPGDKVPVAPAIGERMARFQESADRAAGADAGRIRFCAGHR